MAETRPNVANKFELGADLMIGRYKVGFWDNHGVETCAKEENAAMEYRPHPSTHPIEKRIGLAQDDAEFSLSDAA